MLFSCIFVLAFFAASANAVNLRNGPKNVGIDLHDGAFSSGHHEGRKLQDLDWELNLEDDWPQILFDAGTEDGEVRFRYNYTGTFIPNAKYVEFELRRGDCLTAASADAVVIRALDTTSVPGEITFDVDILQATITSTPEYIEAADGLSADIVFCIRGDYYYEEAGGFKESVLRV